MQPTFNPWIGHFEHIDYVDKFVLLDTVQLTKRDWQTRNRFKLNDQEYMFTIPVKKTGSRDSVMIKDALISFDHFDFRDKLYTLLNQAYKKSPFYREISSFIKELVFFDTDYLSVYHINMIKKISNRIGIQTNISVLSETDFSSENKKSALLLDICKYFKATEYISPLGAKNYLEQDRSLFERENIKITYQNYHHPKYPQLGTSFLPYMGILDLLYNVGLEESLNIIRKGRKYEN